MNSQNKELISHLVSEQFDELLNKVSTTSDHTLTPEDRSKALDQLRKDRQAICKIIVHEVLLKFQHHVNGSHELENFNKTSLPYLANQRHWNLPDRIRGLLHFIVSGGLLSMVNHRSWSTNTQRSWSSSVSLFGISKKSTKYHWNNYLVNTFRYEGIIPKRDAPLLPMLGLNHDIKVFPVLKRRHLSSIPASQFLSKSVSQNLLNYGKETDVYGIGTSKNPSFVFSQDGALRAWNHKKQEFEWLMVIGVERDYFYKPNVIRKEELEKVVLSLIKLSLRKLYDFIISGGRLRIRSKLNGFIDFLIDEGRHLGLTKKLLKLQRNYYNTVSIDTKIAEVDGIFESFMKFWFKSEESDSINKFLLENRLSKIHVCFNVSILDFPSKRVRDWVNDFQNIWDGLIDEGYYDLSPIRYYENLGSKFFEKVDCSNLYGNDYATLMSNITNNIPYLR